MGITNRLWHEQNRMPPRPSADERIRWHLAHASHCACRPVPHGVIALMRSRGIMPPDPHTPAR
ncbi:hypothetical protein [Piscinibacter sp. XHJ-5]|uniref:hypothetical protein n=1 Tax=Piscinibacter sp. XHJ-5 TaxID=3037797 RepID=UPI0024534C67|nr:hypothetical protein [Piscinibacter sp. XHJ-5]